jgi:hypothetical protein
MAAGSETVMQESKMKTVRISKKLESGDEKNAGFGFPEHVANLRPGFDPPRPHKEVETSKNHRRQPSEPKDIPQGPLADRVRKSRKGE